jgi:hypothetical protein
MDSLKGALTLSPQRLSFWAIFNGKRLRAAIERQAKKSLLIERHKKINLPPKNMNAGFVLGPGSKPSLQLSETPESEYGPAFRSSILHQAFEIFGQYNLAKNRLARISTKSCNPVSNSKRFWGTSRDNGLFSSRRSCCQPLQR